MQFGALAINELIARLHGYRETPNRNYAQTGLSLSELAFYLEPEGRVRLPLCPVPGTCPLVLTTLAPF